MIAFANAKINLGLFITGKRPDGYHNLESIFLPVSLADVLEIVPAEKEGIHFASQGIQFGGEADDNLCVKAYHLLSQEFNLGGVNAFLLKNIPVGAGLGGGSSDASFMLQLLNDQFELGLNVDQLRKYAAQLGSDCPFFIENKPAFVTGRGDVLESIDLKLSGTHVVIAYPGVHIGTAEAYKHITPKAPEIDLRNLNHQPKDEWQQYVKNDFEPYMIKTYPQIGMIKSVLAERGSYYTSMTGSGSAVFGLFESTPDIESLFPGMLVRTAELM